MNLNQAKQIALTYLNNENIGAFTLSSFDILHEETNSHVETFLGEIDYIDEDGDDVSSVFSLIVYKNGTTAFEWS